MSMFVLSIIFCSLSFSLAIFLVILLFISQNQARQTSLILLQDQRVENQNLRNQLRAPDVGTLLGLSQATLPSSATASNDIGHDPIDASEYFGEAINAEDALARAGYTVGDLGNDLESAGWAPPIIRRDPDGDPIAYDPS